MRVTCTTIDDFIQNLLAIDPDDLLNRVIFVDIIRREIQPAKYGVVIQATAVVIMGDEVQYLLAAGQDCGRDLATADGNLAGTENAKSLKQKLEEFCQSCGWRILPGVCSE